MEKFRAKFVPLNTGNPHEFHNVLVEEITPEAYIVKPKEDVKIKVTHTEHGEMLIPVNPTENCLVVIQKEKNLEGEYVNSAD